MAYEAVGRNTRTLAQELDVSQRTVQRWLKFEQGAGGEGRNPATSAKAGDIRAIADAEREARALDRLANVREFDSESVDVEYEGEDQGARHARTMPGLPLNLRPAVDLYRQGRPMADVAEAFESALRASYDLPGGLVISEIHGLTLR